MARRFRIPRERLLLNASHTHCGPVVDGMLAVAYDLTAAQVSAIEVYTRDLERRIVETIGAAISALGPATLHTGATSVGFAANRRVQFTPDGPVDHRVPVLRIDQAGRPRAIVFGYACHNTTLQADVVEFHGDYAGVAQAAIEAREPGVTAMFMAGCGADANPKPRGTRALVTQHGESLAEAVLQVSRSLDPVTGALSRGVRHRRPALRARAGPRRLASACVGVSRRLRAATCGADDRPADARPGGCQSRQPDPVQVWRFGRDLTLVALGGEVVVDYALRLYREWPADHVWAAGYSNDVFGYVPSRRVLDEGGYEGGGAMIYYGRPGPFDGTVEDRLMSVVSRLLRRTR